MRYNTKIISSSILTSNVTGGNCAPVPAANTIVCDVAEIPAFSVAGVSDGNVLAKLNRSSVAAKDNGNLGTAWSMPGAPPIKASAVTAVSVADTVTNGIA